MKTNEEIAQGFMEFYRPYLIPAELGWLTETIMRALTDRVEECAKICEQESSRAEKRLVTEEDKGFDGDIGTVHRWIGEADGAAECAQLIRKLNES